MNAIQQTMQYSHFENRMKGTKLVWKVRYVKVKGSNGRKESWIRFLAYKR